MSWVKVLFLIVSFRAFLRLGTAVLIGHPTDGDGARNVTGQADESAGRFRVTAQPGRAGVAAGRP
jgi:hypothetical protein